MSCYHPKKGFILGINPETNKKILKITEYEVQYIEKYKNKYIKVYSSFCGNALNCAEKLCIPSRCGRFRPIAKDNKNSKFYFDWIMIPCGQCIGCRLEHSRQWATRMMLEEQYSTGSCFITLTYDDEHLTKKRVKCDAPWTKKGYIWQNPNVVEFVNTETGEMHDRMTLNKKDWQDFMKRLRKEFGSGVRFYMCGEYGSKNMRMHYHAILYNCVFKDRQYFQHSADGKYNYYTSPTLSRLWPFGFHMITDVTFETCAYVSRYVTKKAKGGSAEDYIQNGLLPEFSLMSRKPGIGRLWFDDHKETLYNTSIINVSTSKGGLKLKPPRYYDNLFDLVDSDRLEEVKADRQDAAESITRLKLDNTDLGYLDLLEVEEYNFEHNPMNKYGLLKRKDL